MELLPRLAGEYGIDLSDHDVIDKVWLAMQTDGPLRQKGYKCHLNRFYGLMEIAPFELGFWWSKLFVTLYTSLESAYLAKASLVRIAITSESSR